MRCYLQCREAPFRLVSCHILTAANVEFVLSFSGRFTLTSGKFVSFCAILYMMSRQ